MRTCEKSWREKFKPARKSPKTRGSNCKKYCSRGLWNWKSPRWREAPRRKARYCNDPIPGHFEPHAFLVLPGQQLSVSGDADCRAEDEHGTPAEAGKPSLALDQGIAAGAAHHHHRA